MNNQEITPMEMYEIIRKNICDNNNFKLYYGAVPGTEYSSDFYSEGIRLMCEAYPEFIKIISDLAYRYYKQDPGTAYNLNNEYERRLKMIHIMNGRLSGFYDTE